MSHPMSDEKLPAPKESSKTPSRRSRWLVAALAIGYALLPFDLVPEALLPVVGWLDDAGVLSLAIAWWVRTGKSRPEPPPELDAPEP